MDYLDKYKLNSGATKEKLHQNGFKNRTFKCYIYKDLIQLIIRVDVENNTFEYQVDDIDSNSLYTPYYRREYGKNRVVKILDSKINKIFKEMEKQNIFEKRGKMNG